MTATLAQFAALKWLRARGSTGVFNKHQVLMAGGELAPIMRSTWNKLAELGFVAFTENRRRCSLTEKGLNQNLNWVNEPEPM